MLNKCTFIGNLGKDPEIRFTNDGKAIANLSIACGERYKDKNGEQQEKTEWVNITAFGKLAEIIQSYVKKGSKIYIEGKMRTRKWTDKEGNDKYTTEIVLDGFDGKMIMLDSKGGGAAPEAPSASYMGDGVATKDPAAAAAQAAEDSIPF